jgi:hypothetical protein
MTYEGFGTDPCLLSRVSTGGELYRHDHHPAASVSGAADGHSWRGSEDLLRLDIPSNHHERGPLYRGLDDFLKLGRVQ